MRTVLLGGASGFIGRELAASLGTDGYRIARLTRGAASGAEVVGWNPEAGVVDAEALRRVAPDVVVNLAGEPISEVWTPARKQRILDSRQRGTAALASALAAMSPRPSLLLNGSAVGYYGSRHGDEPLAEDAPPGADFLAQVCVAWERATDVAASAGIRVANARTGIVLGEGGGALARLLTPFRLGAGGRIGDGRQWMSWISLTDAVRALRFIIDTPALAGPVNVVSPAAVQNAEFASVLGTVLHRPAALPVPAFALKLVFGEMAEHTILGSQRAVPKKLAGAGFEFRHPRLRDALEFELRR